MLPDKSIRLLLAEDQTIVRLGILRLLELVPQMQVVAEASDGEQALQAILEYRPDVALLDIRMPKRTGIEVARELRRLEVAVPVVLLTTFDEDPLFLEAIQSGASGFLLKDVSLERLVETIAAVAAGGTLLQPALTERVIRVVRERGVAFDHGPSPDRLSPLQHEVLRLLAGGLSNREIAEALATTEGSIKNTVSAVLTKLGVRDRTRAVLRGIELGYL